MDLVAGGTLDAVRRDVDSFLLSLPLRNDRASADVEEAVARKLINCEVERLKLQNKLHQWVQVATELYHVVEESSQVDERFGSRLKGPSAFFDSSMAEGIVSQGHFSSGRGMESFGNNGAQMVLWAEQRHPKSFIESQGVLSDVNNLKREVADLKRTLWNQNSDPQVLSSPWMLPSRGQQQVTGPVAHKCESCEVLRTQLQGQLQQTTTAQEEKSNLRRSLLDAEIELQKLTASGESMGRQLQESEANVLHLKSNQAKVLQDLEREKELHKATHQKLEDATKKIRLLEEAQQAHQGTLCSQQEELAVKESREMSLMKEVEEKSKEIQELKHQLAELLQRIGDLEGEFNDREAAVNAEQATNLSRVTDLEDENRKLMNHLQGLKASLQETSNRLAERELQQAQDKVLETKVHVLEERLKDTEARLGDEQCACSKQREEAEQLQKRLEKLEVTTREASTALQHLRQENSHLLNELHMTKTELTSKSLERKEDELATIKLEESNGSLQEEIAKMMQHVESLQEDLQNAELRKTELEGTVEKQNREIGKLRGTATMQECEVKSLIASVEALQEEIKKQKAASSVKQNLDLQHQLGLANEGKTKLAIDMQERQQELRILRAKNAGLQRQLTASNDLVSEMEKRISTVNQHGHSGGTTPEVAASMRRLQGLLYSQEKDLRRAQMKVEELQGQLRWWEGNHSDLKKESPGSKQADMCQRSPSIATYQIEELSSNGKERGRHSDSSDSD